MTDRLTSSDPALIASVKLGEGLRLNAYPDPLTRASPWTLGYGHTGPDVGPSTCCTAASAEAWLKADLAEAMNGLDASVPWWRTLPIEAQRVFAELAFNMGIRRLMGFHRFLAAAQAGDWAQASTELMHSLWATQVKSRADRLSAALTALAPHTATQDA